MTIDFSKILNWILNNIPTVIAIIGLLLEITPLHPFRRLFNRIGNLCNKELKADVAKIQTEVIGVKEDIKTLQTEIDTQEINTLRRSILSFADECRNDVHHSKEAFEQVIRDGERYKALLEKTNCSNGVFTISYEYILDLYKQCLKNNSFLP